MEVGEDGELFLLIIVNMSRTSRWNLFGYVTVLRQSLEEIYAQTQIITKNMFPVPTQTMKVESFLSISKKSKLNLQITCFKPECTKLNRINFSLDPGKGITNCTMVPGELTSGSEQYLETTQSAHECQRRVKIREPDANGITWTHNGGQCWAKFSSSDSVIDDNGCTYCSSCFFGKSYN